MGCRLLTGECSITVHGPARETTTRGRVVVIVKPDDTVLVHDANGYQPVAWLTRAGSVRVERSNGVEIHARDGRRRLRVQTVGPHVFRGASVSPAGATVGVHPECGGSLIEHSAGVTCLDCGERFLLPAGTTVLKTPCEECGAPTIRVTRGAVLVDCLVPACRSLEASLETAINGEWRCPECHTGLSVETSDDIVASCPDCDRTHPIPPSPWTGTGPCGLPTFSVSNGTRCLDPSCECPMAT